MKTNKQIAEEIVLEWADFCSRQQVTGLDKNERPSLKMIELITEALDKKTVKVTDEEIEKADLASPTWCNGDYGNFVDGAKWMREKYEGKKEPEIDDDTWAKMIDDA